jgi:hypothetical protein
MTAPDGQPHAGVGATHTAPAPSRWYCTGLPTGLGGLFFLLHVLRRIGLPEALAGGLGEAGPNFPIRVFRHLAAHAGAASDDPVVAWLDWLLAREAENGAVLPCDASSWPANLPLARAAASREDLVRAWSLGVRRWCWRVARISARATIARPGVFSVNRTDLDVSLPLEEADVRVRRAGLDLDPGWLPWFGRVVRFHYLYRREFRA